MKILWKLFKREYVSKICNFKELFGYIATWKCWSSHQRCSMEKRILDNCARVSFFNSLFIKKETLAQVFSYEVCKISKNTFFTKHIWATASAHVMNLPLFLILKSVNMIFVLICCKNMTIMFSRSVSNSLFVQIVYTALEKNISINTLYDNGRLFVVIHKVEEWSKIVSWCNCCVFLWP